jgi:hypothetical protein
MGSRRKFIRAISIAGMARLLPLSFYANAGGNGAPGGGDTSIKNTYYADCIHAWPHNAVGTACNAYFVGLPFGSVEQGEISHWLIGQVVECRQSQVDNCSRFGPSAQRVKSASFVVNWIRIRRDVYGRIYTVISNLIQSA